MSEWVPVDVRLRGDRELLMKAASLAATAHSGQLRKGSWQEPYINHPLRVAVAAEEIGLSSDAIAAALLHDVPEDTGVTVASMVTLFPEPVLHLVTLLTKWWDLPKSKKELPPDVYGKLVERVRVEYKPEYYRRIAGDREAVALKFLDRADNLHGAAACVPTMRGWAYDYLGKTDKEFAPLIALVYGDKVLELAFVRFRHGRDTLAAALA